MFLPTLPDFTKLSFKMLSAKASREQMVKRVMTIPSRSRSLADSESFGEHCPGPDLRSHSRITLQDGNIPLLARPPGKARPSISSGSQETSVRPRKGRTSGQDLESHRYS